MVANTGRANTQVDRVSCVYASFRRGVAARDRLAHDAGRVRRPVLHRDGHAVFQLGEARCGHLFVGRQSVGDLDQPATAALPVCTWRS